MSAAAKLEIQAFFDEPTNTVSYLVWDADTMDGAVIDPVLDFDHRSGEATVESADAMLAEAARRGIKIGQVLETHVHADHLSGAPYIKLKTGAKVCIGEHVRDVQKHLPSGLQRHRRVGRRLRVRSSVQGRRALQGRHRRCRGDRTRRAIRRPASRTGSATRYSSATPCSCPTTAPRAPTFPAATPARCTGRSSAYSSLPPETRLFMCHDYKAPGRDQYAWETTVGEEKASNVHVHEGISEDEFVAMREARDATLSAPLLLLPSIQVNMRAGNLPPAEVNGVHYLKVPIKLAS